MAKSLIKTWKKFVPESAEKKEKKKEEKEKSKDDKNGAEDDQSTAGLSSGPIGDKSSSFPPRPQPTSDQGWNLNSTPLELEQNTVLPFHQLFLFPWE